MSTGKHQPKRKKYGDKTTATTAAIDETDIANQYIALLRSQAMLGYDYAAKVLNTGEIWFMGVGLSILLFLLFYVSSYVTSTWGSSAGSNILAHAAKQEIKPLMQQTDPALDSAEVIFDLNKGTLGASRFNDGREGLWSSIYSMAKARMNGNSAEPGAATKFVLIHPDGTEQVVGETRPLPAISMPIDSVLKNECKLTIQEAQRYLCDRGISSNSKAKRALNSLVYCRREMQQPLGCTMWRACTKQVIKEHFSKPSVIGVTDSVLLGDGLTADIPSDLCDVDPRQ